VPSWQRTRSPSTSEYTTWQTINLFSRCWN